MMATMKTGKIFSRGKDGDKKIPEKCNAGKICRGKEIFRKLIKYLEK